MLVTVQCASSSVAKYQSETALAWHVVVQPQHAARALVKLALHDSIRSQRGGVRRVWVCILSISGHGVPFVLKLLTGSVACDVSWAWSL